MALALGFAAGSYFGWPAGLAAFLAAAAAMLALRTRYDQAVPAFWIGRICAFCIDQGGGRTPDMEQRIDAFADHVAEQVATGEDDEVRTLFLFK